MIKENKSDESVVQSPTASIQSGPFFAAAPVTSASMVGATPSGGLLAAPASSVPVANGTPAVAPGSATPVSAPQMGPNASPPVRAATPEESLDFVREMVTFLEGAGDFFKEAHLDETTFERVFTGWLRMDQQAQGILHPPGQAGGQAVDPSLESAYHRAFTGAIRALFGRASTQVNKPLIRLYLENMYRLPAWAWPDSGIFTGGNEKQRKNFVQDFTLALQDTALFGGYTNLDQVKLEEILGRLKTLVNDTQVLIAGQLGNDISMKTTMQQAYSRAVETLLSRASVSMHSSLFQLYMRYRYGGQQLIHEWGDQHVPGITAGIPLGTGGPDPLTGNVSFMLSGFRVTILPDGVQTESGGGTRANFSYPTPGFHYTGATVDHIDTIQTPEITIQTSYGPGASPGGTSGYGRGTTPDDQAHGDTSLGFHEGSHGSDYLNTINSATAPVFGGSVGMTIPNYHTAVTSYQAAMAAFSATLTRSSELLTDCVGHPTITDYYRAQGNVPPVRCP